MSNSTNTTSALSASVSQALTICPIMDKNMLIILYIGGTLGSFFNIFTLLQKKFRTNSCSLYFLSASITDLFVMNCVIFMDGLRYFNPPLFNRINTSSIGCKLGKYPIFLLSCLSSTFITLASIDRFCTSSQNVQIRKFSQVKVSRILILSVTLIWALFSTHITFLFDILPLTPSRSDPCQNPPNLYVYALIVDGYFFSIYNGLIVPLLLFIFGLLTYRNVQLSRRRIVPLSNTNHNGTGTMTHNPQLNRQNLHLITMVLVQSCVTILLNIPYMIIALYNWYDNPPSNQLLLLLYIIFVYIARWFWFSNYVKTFYINTLSSQLFRNTLKEKMICISQQSRARFLQRTRI